MSSSVNKQVFDFTCNSESIAREVQKQFIHYTSPKLNAIFNELINEHTDENYFLKIDKIEIDLGNFSLEDFKSDKIFICFKKKLSEIFTSFHRENQTIQNEKKTSADTELEALLTFLLTGGVPWWMEKTNVIDLNMMLKNQINNVNLKQFFETHRDNDAVSERLFYTFKPGIPPLTRDLPLIRDLIIGRFTERSVLNKFNQKTDVEFLSSENLLKIESIIKNEISDHRHHDKLSELIKRIGNLHYEWFNNLKALNFFPDEDLKKIESLFTGRQKNEKYSEQKLIAALTLLPHQSAEYLLKKSECDESAFNSNEETHQRTYLLHQLINYPSFDWTDNLKSFHAFSTVELAEIKSLLFNRDKADKVSEQKLSESLEVLSVPRIRQLLQDELWRDYINLEKDEREKNLLKLISLPYQKWFNNLKKINVFTADELINVKSLLIARQRNENTDENELLKILNVLSAYHIEYLLQKAFNKKKSAEQVVQHPYFLKYNLLEIIASIDFMRKDSPVPAEDKKEKIGNLPEEISVRLSASISVSINTINALSRNEKIILRDVLKKGLWETKNEKGKIKKILLKLPAEIIHLMLTFTELPEEEIKFLQSQLLQSHRLQSQHLQSQALQTQASQSPGSQSPGSQSPGSQSQDSQSQGSQSQGSQSQTLQSQGSQSQGSQSQALQSQALQSHNKEKEHFFQPENVEGLQKIYIENAGLCLIALYLPSLFKSLNYLENNKFKNKVYAQRGLHLLQYIASGKKKDPEYLLQFNKLLCGYDVTDVVSASIRLTNKEIAEADNLIDSIIAHWKALKNTSKDGLRSSFLQRKGILTQNENYWTLQVEQKGFDILLDNIPWGYTMIKLPWMKKHIQVEW